MNPETPCFDRKLYLPKCLRLRRHHTLPQKQAVLDDKTKDPFEV